MSYTPFYNRRFPPIVKPLEALAVPRTPDYSVYDYYQVKTITAIPRLVVPIVPRTDPSFTSIGAGQEIVIDDPRELRVGSNELLQLRIARITAPVEITLGVGGARSILWNYLQSWLYIGPGNDVVDDKLYIENVAVDTASPTDIASAPQGYTVVLDELEVVNTSTTATTLTILKYDSASGNYVPVKQVTVPPSDSLSLYRDDLRVTRTWTRIAVQSSITGVYVSGTARIVPVIEDEYLTEFWKIPDYDIVLRVKNILGTSLPDGHNYSEVQMILYGYRYVVEKLANIPEKYTVVTALPVQPVPPIKR